MWLPIWLMPNLRAAYDDIYSPQGQSENYIKGHKLYLRSNCTSYHCFQANKLRLFLHSTAYVLLHTMQHKLLLDTQWAKHGLIHSAGGY